MFLPVGCTFVFFLGNSLHLFAESCLFGKIVFFLCPQLLEVLLMFLVDHSAGCLEAGPYLLSLFLGHRTDFAILLMQLLQLVERTDDVVYLVEFLGSLTEFGLELQVLLEVKLAGFTVEFQQVVELFHIELIVTPQFIGFLGWHSLDFLPLLLQRLKFLI